MRIRIAYLKAAALQAFDVVKFCSFQELHIIFADDYLNLFLGKYQIKVSCVVIKFKPVLES